MDEIQEEMASIAPLAFFKWCWSGGTKRFVWPLYNHYLGSSEK